MLGSEKGRFGNMDIGLEYGLGSEVEVRLERTVPGSE